MLRGLVTAAGGALKPKQRAAKVAYAADQVAAATEGARRAALYAGPHAPPPKAHAQDAAADDEGAAAGGALSSGGEGEVQPGDGTSEAGVLLHPQAGGGEEVVAAQQTTPPPLPSTAATAAAAGAAAGQLQLLRGRVERQLYSCLTFLDLSGNSLGAQGTAAVAQVCSRCPAGTAAAMGWKPLRAAGGVPQSTTCRQPALQTRPLPTVPGPSPGLQVLDGSRTPTQFLCHLVLDKCSILDAGGSRVPGRAPR